MCGIHRDQFNCKLPNSIQWITKQKGHHPRSSAQSDTYQPLSNLFPWTLKSLSVISVWLCTLRWQENVSIVNNLEITFLFLPRKILKEKRSTGRIETFSNRVIWLLVSSPRTLYQNHWSGSGSLGLIIVHQRNRWIPSGYGFIGFSGCTVFAIYSQNRLVDTVNTRI